MRCNFFRDSRNVISFLLQERSFIWKKLEQIRQESKEIKDKIDHTEERLRQLKNQEKKILKQDIVKRRIFHRQKDKKIKENIGRRYLHDNLPQTFITKSKRWGQTLLWRSRKWFYKRVSTNNRWNRRWCNGYS